MVEMALYVAKVDAGRRKIELDLQMNKIQMSLIYNNTSNYKASNLPTRL